MAEFRIFLALAAVLVFSLGLAERGFRLSVTPFIVLTSTMLFFSLLGSFGLLYLAGILYYLLALAVAGYLIFRFVLQKKPFPKLTFGFTFFILASIGIILLLWIRQPMFSTWDEFSFWGTAAKIAKLFNEFYTTATVGWGLRTNPPAMVAFAYAFQFLGSGFIEWQVYAAYDILAFAFIACMVSPFDGKNWNIAVPLTVTALVTPFVFIHYLPPIKISPVYLDSLGDVPMALLFAGALILYFSGEKTNLKTMVPVWVTLASLTLIKDTSFAFAMVAAGLIFVDQLAAKRPKETLLKTKLIHSFGFFAISLVCVIGAYVGWAIHLSAVLEVNRFDFGGAQNVSMANMPLLALGELTSANPSPHFVKATTGMASLFVHQRLTLLGTGVIVVGIILALTFFAALITKEGAHRRRCIIFGIFSTLGFAAYYLLITLTYIYIFPPDQIFASYERYIYPYYIGWFLLAAFLLATSAKNSRFVIEGKAALLFVCTLFCFRFLQYIPLSYSVIGFNTEEFADRRDFARQTQLVTSQLPPDSLTFIVSQDDNGVKWFTYCFEFLPLQVDYSFGGGIMAAPGALPEGTDYYHPVTRQEWADLLQKNGITHVLIDNSDDLFYQEYNKLFSDNMSNFIDGNTNLYTVRQKGDSVLLEPVL